MIGRIMEEKQQLDLHRDLTLESIASNKKWRKYFLNDEFMQEGMYNI